MSYRRNDVPLVAREIRAALREKLFKEAFFDLRSTHEGRNWKRAITWALGRSDVVFVVIGPNWGPERTIDVDDAVAAELVAARHNRAIIVPLLVGSGEIPSAADLADDLAFLPDLQAPGTLPKDPIDPDLWPLTQNAAAAPAAKARRRKLVARTVVPLIAALAASAWFVGRSEAACGTPNLDVGVAVVLADLRTAPEGEAPEAARIADSFAEELRSGGEQPLGIEAIGPRGCRRLDDVVASPEDVAAEAELDVLVTGDLVLFGEESQLGLSMTFDPAAVPDAPEVAGTHQVAFAMKPGRNVMSPVLAQRYATELGQVGTVLLGMQLYATGSYEGAATQFSALSQDSSGEVERDLQRVTGLLWGNALLQQARDLQDTDPSGADELFEDAVSVYTGIATVDGVDYGRAHLGIGVVAVERCRARLASVDDSATPLALEPGFSEGLGALDTAIGASTADAATHVEVDLKSTLARGDLALCGLLTLIEVNGDRDERLELADAATDDFEDVVDGVVEGGRYGYLGSEGGVGLALMELLACDHANPASSVERARDHLEKALPAAAPWRSVDIQGGIAVLDQALADGTAGSSASAADGSGDIGVVFEALLVAACGLPRG